MVTASGEFGCQLPSEADGDKNRCSAQFGTSGRWLLLQHRYRLAT